MVVDATIEAVVFLASRTVELRCLFFLGVKDESELAVCSRAPRDVLLHVDCLVKSKATVLLVLVLFQQVLEVGIAYLNFALGVWTEDGQFSLLNLGP